MSLFFKTINNNIINLSKHTEVIIFDFDGVLVESLDIKTEGFLELYKNLNSNSLNYIRNHHLSNGGISRYLKIRHYHKYLLNIELSETEVNELANKFSNIILEKMFKVKFVPGIISLLKKINNKYKIFLSTSTPYDEIEKIIKNRKLSNYFLDFYGSPDDKIFQINQIINQYKINLKKTIFIGDSKSDYEAATTHNINFLLRQHKDNINDFRNIKCLKIFDFLI